MLLGHNKASVEGVQKRSNIGLVQHLQTNISDQHYRGFDQLEIIYIPLSFLLLRLSFLKQLSSRPPEKSIGIKFF